MPVYAFLCDKCGRAVEQLAKHPDEVDLTEFEDTCDEGGSCDFYRDYSGQAGFILKGGGWAGKEITRENEGTSTAEKAEAFHDNLDQAQAESKEVLEARRKGKKHYKQYQKHNKEKIKRYHDNMRKGIKAKDDKQD